MTFFDDIEAAVNDLFAVDGQPITYGGSAVDAINITYAKDDNRRDTAQVEVRRSDVPSPAYRDTVVIDGATWTVRHWTAGNRLTWVVALEKSVRPGFER